MTEAEQPCPFCGSTDLQTGSWCIDESEAYELVKPGDLGEVPSIECNRCMGSAPAENWNKRHQPELSRTEGEMITINGEGLQPHLEAAMGEIVSNLPKQRAAEAHSQATLTVSKNPTDWRWPKGDKNIPAPGQRVLAFFPGIAEPIIATPVHADGSHLINGESIYSKVICWHPIPAAPEFGEARQ